MSSFYNDIKVLVKLDFETLKWSFVTFNDLSSNFKFSGKLQLYNFSYRIIWVSKITFFVRY